MCCLGPHSTRIQPTLQLLNALSTEPRSPSQLPYCHHLHVDGMLGLPVVSTTSLSWTFSPQPPPRAGQGRIDPTLLPFVRGKPEARTGLRSHRERDPLMPASCSNHRAGWPSREVLALPLCALRPLARSCLPAQPPESSGRTLEGWAPPAGDLGSCFRGPRLPHTHRQCFFPSLEEQKRFIASDSSLCFQSSCTKATSRHPFLEDRWCPCTRRREPKRLATSLGKVSSRVEITLEGLTNAFMEERAEICHGDFPVR